MGGRSARIALASMWAAAVVAAFDASDARAEAKAVEAGRQGELAALSAAARRELGAKAPVEVVEDAFVFAALPGNETGLRSSTAFARSVLAALTNERFPKLPSKPVTVLVFFGERGYERYCKTSLGERCISRFGFFLHDRRTIVMNAEPGLGTLSHELVHPLVAEDFPEAPLWLNEGIASLFEAPAIGRPGQIHGVKNWRHPRLVTALRSKTEAHKARLDTLLSLDDDTFRDGDEDLHYAAARYMCQWLDAQSKLWAFYARFRETRARDPHGVQAFADVVGKSPADAHDAWAKWVLAL